MPAVPWQIPAPFRSLWAPACHVSSAPASSSSSSRYGAVVETIPGAPWHHCTLISPVRRCSRLSSAAGGQLQSPPSRTAKRVSVSFVSRPSRSACLLSKAVRSACTLPTKPCTGPRDRVSLKRRCVHNPSGSRRASSASALSSQARRQRSSPVPWRSTRAASSVPAVPHMSSSISSASMFARTRLWRSSARSGRRVNIQATSRTPASPARRDDSRCGRSASSGKTTGSSRHDSSASRATAAGTRVVSA